MKDQGCIHADDDGTESQATIPMIPLNTRNAYILNLGFITDIDKTRVLIRAHGPNTEHAKMNGILWKITG